MAVAKQFPLTPINSQVKRCKTKRKAWCSNKLPEKWKNLKKSPNWWKLSKLEQQILKLGWPNRYLKLSYSEIATLLNIQRTAAIRLMKKLEKIEFVTKKKSFIQKKNGNYTKIHKRNYYVFTDAGKAGIEILLNRLFLHDQNEPLKDLTNVRKSKPGESFSSHVHPQKEKLSEIKKSFKKFSFERQLFRAYKGTLNILLENPIERIEKILKLMRKKIQKGWKLREFWGFFLKQLKDPKKVRSFFPYLANAYLEASGGKYNSMARGVDSSIIAESLKKLQKTGEVISENKLSRILSYGTQKVKAALEGICYRSYLGRGILPESKVEIKNPQKIEKRPIKDFVKINFRTGEIYSDEDLKNKEMFSMKTVIVGYEEIEPLKMEEKIQERAPSIKIRSWVGLLIETLETCKDCESIYRRYFFKRYQYISTTIEWARDLLKRESKRCVFDRGVEFEKWSKEKNYLDTEKIFIRFRIFKKEEKSFINLLYWDSGKWRERRLGVVHPLFKKDLVEVFESIGVGGLLKKKAS